LETAGVAAEAAAGAEAGGADAQDTKTTAVQAARMWRIHDGFTRGLLE
jgi:hypothetical protein